MRRLLRPLALVLAAPLLTLLGIAAVTTPASAQEGIELTGFVGYLSGGSIDVLTQTRENAGTIQSDAAPSFGAAFSYPVGEGSYFEVFYNRQITTFTSTGVQFPDSSTTFDGTIQYFHAGMLLELELGDDSLWAPFGSLTIGATRFSANSADLEPSTRFSAALSLGAKWRLNDWLRLRAQARGFATIFASGTQLFCSDGDCLVNQDGQVFLQGEVSAGVAIVFH